MQQHISFDCKYEIEEKSEKLVHVNERISLERYKESRGLDRFDAYTAINFNIGGTMPSRKENKD